MQCRRNRTPRFSRMNLHQFLDASTCNFLAVDAITSQLREAGFTELREADKWDIKPGDKHY
ncbi:MAG: hypothetical protein K2L71_09735, partial [Muribaculaceae bacterium]|nr:hypothetical protein [Muribaculaceae bacterium]